MWGPSSPPPHDTSKFAVKPHLTAFVAFCTSFKNLLDRDFPHFSDIMGWMVGVYTKIMQPLTFGFFLFCFILFCFVLFCFVLFCSVCLFLCSCVCYHHLIISV